MKHGVVRGDALDCSDPHVPYANLPRWFWMCWKVDVKVFESSWYRIHMKMCRFKDTCSQKTTVEAWQQATEEQTYLCLAKKKQ
eukprot:4066286-Amphidinium_carterae.1